MEVAEDERSLRRARRWIWAFRLIFYPGAAIIAILLLTASGGSKASPPLEGRTGQGETFRIWFNDDDRPAQFLTRINTRCPDTGWWYHLDWHRIDATRISFDEDTGAVSAAYEWQGRWSDTVPANLEAHLEGRVDDDQVTGTLRLVDHRPGMTCDSGVVSFSAG